MEKNAYIDVVRSTLIANHGMERTDADAAIRKYNLSARIDRCPLILNHDDPKATAEFIRKRWRKERGMTREEAIDWMVFQKEQVLAKSGDKPGTLTVAYDMAIEALQAEAVQGWIPCSEKLPEVGEICLLTVHEYGWNCKEYTRVIIGEYSDNYANHILAWMPLPTPYKDEERREE